MVMYVVDINDLTNENIIEELNNISEYINYGIHFTIVKQLGNIELETEAKYAVKILNNFIKGQTNAFTGKNNIRTNMKSIDSIKIIALLIKSAIDRYAFNTIKLKKLKMESNEDKVAETITEQLFEGNFEEILSWITSDSRIMTMLIENHIDLYYQGDRELIDAYAYMTDRHAKTKIAIKELLSYLKLENEKSK